MIEKELSFNFNLNIDKIFELCVDENSEMVKRVPEIIEYKQGEWKNNIKKNIVKLQLTNIPAEIPTKYLNLVLNDDKTIYAKIKVNLIHRDKNYINLKFTLKPVSKILSQINNILKLSRIKATINIRQCENIAKIDAKYKITVINIMDNIDIIENYIEKNLNKLLIETIISYLTEIEKNLFIL